jgi:hypothetical protein
LKKNKKVLVLTGGLGNQLFQLAAGLTTSSPENLILERNLGKPRLNRQGNPDIDSFLFPRQLTFNALYQGRLRLSIFGSFLFKISSKTFNYKFLQNIWLWMKKKVEFCGVFISNGVGFDPRLVSGDEFKFIFGPFHTYRYLESESIRRFMCEMSPKVSPSWLNDLRIASAFEKPIVLHIRLADYKGIEELGILRADYFRNSLNRALKLFPESRVWLFSDEEDIALEILDSHIVSSIRVINYDKYDSAANLEAMRLGHCYVLSNSTFSWWGAYLSYFPNAKVFCPSNWFRTKQNPLFMIPNEWEMVDNL